MVLARDASARVRSDAGPSDAASLGAVDHVSTSVGGEVVGRRPKQRSCPSPQCDRGPSYGEKGRGEASGAAPASTRFPRCRYTRDAAAGLAVPAPNAIVRPRDQPADVSSGWAVVSSAGDASAFRLMGWCRTIFCPTDPSTILCGSAPRLDSSWHPCTDLEEHGLIAGETRVGVIAARQPVRISSTCRLALANRPSCRSVNTWCWRCRSTTCPPVWGGGQMGVQGEGDRLLDVAAGPGALSLPAARLGRACSPWTTRPAWSTAHGARWCGGPSEPPGSRDGWHRAGLRRWDVRCRVLPAWDHALPRFARPVWLSLRG